MVLLKGVSDWLLKNDGFARAVQAPVSVCLAAAFLAPVCSCAPMTSTHLCWELAQEVSPR